MERTSTEDITLSGDGKVGKNSQLKQKTKKRHGCVFPKCKITLFIIW